MSSESPTTKAERLRIPGTIWALGFVSLFMDLSSELVHSLLPVFLVTTLGASALTVGVIEGIAESTAMLVKIFSGAISDFMGRRKGLCYFPEIINCSGRVQKNGDRIEQTHLVAEPLAIGWLCMAS